MLDQLGLSKGNLLAFDLQDGGARGQDIPDPVGPGAIHEDEHVATCNPVGIEGCPVLVARPAPDMTQHGPHAPFQLHRVEHVLVDLPPPQRHRHQRSPRP